MGWGCELKSWETIALGLWKGTEYGYIDGFFQIGVELKVISGVSLESL